MTPTEKYIDVLQNLKTGDLGLLRTHAGQGLDESVHAFDLFAGLWWPLREKNQRAPRRGVAWLIAKLYAACPLPHSPNHTLARQLRRCLPNKDPSRQRFQERFDRMLMLSLDEMEPVLRWALDEIATTTGTIDWVQLTDDLSKWERETTRLRWAEQFLDHTERT